MSNTHDIRILLVTQNGVRDPGQIPAMAEFVRRGGVLSGETSPRRFSPIHIARMPDGLRFIHDGHHRAVACLLGGRDRLLGPEFTEESYSYGDYLAANPARGWLTPLDLKRECRLAEFFAYKDAARDVPVAGLDAHCRAHAASYKERRRAWSVGDLSRTI